MNWEKFAVYFLGINSGVLTLLFIITLCRVWRG